MAPSLHFFLELFAHSSPVAYWVHTDLGNSSFSVISFCIFILFIGFSSHEYGSGLPFPSPVDHIFSDVSTMTHQSWVALHGMVHSFIGLDKAVVHVISLISFLWLWFSFSALSEIRIRGLWNFPDGRDWLWGWKLGLVPMGRPMLSKFLTQFSVDGWGCVPSLYLTWEQTMVEVVKIMVTYFKRSHAHTATLIAPDPLAGHHRPTPLREVPGHSQARVGQSLVGSLLLYPGSWCTQAFVCALQESVSPVLCKFCNQIPLASKVNFSVSSQSLCQVPRLRNLLWALELS